MRRQKIVAVLVAVLLLSTLPGAATAQVAGFTDVSPGSTHASAIQRAVELDIVRGTTPTTFSPGRPVTRAQAASLLLRALQAADVEVPGAEGAPNFDDLDGTHGQAVRRLAAAGIVQGLGDGRFGPTRPVTREQFASLVVRAVAFATGLPVRPFGTNPFTDVTGGTHRDAIVAASELGVLQGKGDGIFDPRSSTRRDQSASIVIRFLDHLLELDAGEVWVLDQGTDIIHVYDGTSGFDEIASIDVRPSTLASLGFEDAPTGAATVPHMIEFDSQGRFAFIASTAGGVTLVVDARSKEVVEVLATGAGTHMAAVTPDDSAVWIAVIGNSAFPRVDNSSQRFTEIEFGDLDDEAPTFTIGRELLVADLIEPWEDGTHASYEFPSFSAICHQYSADGSEAWLTLGPGWNQGALVVVDLDEGELSHAYDPEIVKANCGVSVTEDRVVANWSGRLVENDYTNGEWYVFDPDTYEQIGDARDAEGFDAHGIRLNPQGTNYWFVNRASDNALVVDAETLEVVARYDGLLDTPDIIDYSPDGRFVYVTQRGPNPRSGAIHAASGDTPGLAIVDAATGQLVHVLEQDYINSGEGALLNDVHGVGVRQTSEQDVAPEELTFSATSFVFDDEPRPEPVNLGFHCGLAGNIAS